MTRQANHHKVVTIKQHREPKIGPSEADIKCERKVIAEEPGSPKPDQTKMLPEDRDSLQPEAKIKPQEADQVCIHEDGDLFAEDIDNQIAVLPEVVTTTEEVTTDDIQVEDPESSSNHLEESPSLDWEGECATTAALGAIGDIDDEDAAPIAQRCRRVAPLFREKLSNLIKVLLSATIITHSTSPWASPIVIIIKKNGVGIRLCIDYRLVNSLTKLMVYHMRLINDLLEALIKVLWYWSLDMASGFWGRERKISGFIPRFGLFEWARMPFGLKNTPQIYQRLIENALYGHLRIGPGQDSSRTTDVYTEGEPEPVMKPSVLGRRSYIDDILVTAPSWDDLCEKVEKLHNACHKWNLSISVVESFWGLRKVTSGGEPERSRGLRESPVPANASLNAIVPWKLELLSKISRFTLLSFMSYFHEIRRREKISMSARGTGGELAPKDEYDRWTQANVAFTMLKAKIVSTPVQRHFDPDRTPVVVLYASKCAISAALMQEHDGVY
ncbi:LOW QUALITY PROTEIN: Reverse transcriptase [Phytophthora palmivora]|uniref:Reverse transcriptase n=1 Tax=Phytophthora palmivora TaxID=4796 RepID=A0A2P4Y8F6_9STRA|nr:LOW QUALITY PROTEIN: Reverse transcriptase [Phytophthora palmivora]